jgi:hypothetical protein
MAYLLDANVFIQAKNRHYGFDFCPAFWDWLTASHAAGLVFSIARVRHEIDAGDDDLAEWAGRQAHGFFLEPDPEMVPALGRVSAWATGRDYEQAGIATFLNAADYYLVGQALAHSHTVVTAEIASGSKKRIKIPDACIAVGVRCVTPFVMLRESRARFELAA